MTTRLPCDYCDATALYLVHSQYARAAIPVKVHICERHRVALLGQGDGVSRRAYPLMSAPDTTVPTVSAKPKPIAVSQTPKKPKAKVKTESL